MYFWDDCELDEELPSVSMQYTRKVNYSHSSRLEEFRCIKEEQNVQYNTMIENDLALEKVVHWYNFGDGGI